MRRATNYALNSLLKKLDLLFIFNNLKLRFLYFEVLFKNIKQKRLDIEVPEHRKNMQKQHYVPKCLLKNFARGKELFVFDKHTGRIEIKNIKSVCSSVDFYEIKINEIVTLTPKIKQKIKERTFLNDGDIEKIIDDGVLSLEDTLAQIETVAGEIIKKLKK